ncbi:MAG TPA: hypothetical protein VHV76_07355 [Mycobacteriales bacterium]|nr:hypothetical protein [Mycobacteriales bacterium]
MRPARALPVLAALVVAGFAIFGWSWHGAKHARYVPLQVPWVISGGLAGLALIGLSMVSWHIYLCRSDDADHRAEWDAFTREAIDVLADR